MVPIKAVGVVTVFAVSSIIFSGIVESGSPFRLGKSPKLMSKRARSGLPTAPSKVSA